MAKAKKRKGSKTKRSPKQIAATKRMLAANKRKGGGKRSKKRSRATGALTSKGFPKSRLRKNAIKLGAVLRREGMGTVTLKG